MPIPRRCDQIAVSSNVSTLHPPCSFSRHQMVHFDFPRADGRQIFSIPCCGESIVTASPPRGSSCDPARSDSGPVILVFVDKDGKYYTDYGSQGIHLRHIDRLMLAVLKQLEGDAQPLQQLDVADTTKLEELSITATSSSSYKQDTIWFRTEYGWQITFYTWIDHAGSFHTYPNVGGPFHSLDQVDKAIDQYLSHCLHPKMRMEQDSVSQEMAVWQSLHWPDGRRRMRLETEPIDERRCSVLQLVKALLDKYNDDHNLSEDLEYKLEYLWRYRYFHDADSNGVYYHINFTTKTKGVDGHCNLFFFAELVLRGRKEFVVSCLCRVDVRNASCCYACMSDIMRHPKAGAYSGGLSEDCCSRGMFCYAGPDVDLGCTHEELEAEEASVRHMYEGLDTSDFLESQVSVLAWSLIRALEWKCTMCQSLCIYCEP